MLMQEQVPMQEGRLEARGAKMHPSVMLPTKSSLFYHFIKGTCTIL